MYKKNRLWSDAAQKRHAFCAASDRSLDILSQKSIHRKQLSRFLHKICFFLKRDFPTRIPFFCYVSHFLALKIQGLKSGIIEFSSKEGVVKSAFERTMCSKCRNFYGQNQLLRAKMQHIRRNFYIWTDNSMCVEEQKCLGFDCV